jgi:hypothetical protein
MVKSLLFLVQFGDLVIYVLLKLFTQSLVSQPLERRYAFGVQIILEHHSSFWMAQFAESLIYNLPDSLSR